MGSTPKTLAEKVWDEHVVRTAEGEPDLLFIDLHLLHEVTSPQAFDGLRLAGRAVRRPDLTLATEDHNVPTIDWDKPIADPVSRTQVETHSERSPSGSAPPKSSTSWPLRPSPNQSPRRWRSRSTVPCLLG